VPNPPRLRDFPGFLRPRFVLRASRPAPEASQAGAWLSRPSRRRERPLGAALKPVQEVLTAVDIDLSAATPLGAHWRNALALAVRIVPTSRDPCALSLPGFSAGVLSG
jgi:hypothetical protein